MTYEASQKFIVKTYWTDGDVTHTIEMNKREAELYANRNRDSAIVIRTEVVPTIARETTP
jgi:hypothetical protein